MQPADCIRCAQSPSGKLTIVPAEGRKRFGSFHAVRPRRLENEAVDTPVLYLRGEKDPGLAVERYVDGLRRAGLRNVAGKVIAKSGHFVADEQPHQLLAVLREFLELAN